MPELPEVETVRRIIEPLINDKTVTDIRVNSQNVIAHPSADVFRALITGKTFSGINRRGKFLIFRFAGGDRMILHLRMTGCLIVTSADHPSEKHTHLIFRLSDESENRKAPDELGALLDGLFMNGLDGMKE